MMQNLTGQSHKDVRISVFFGVITYEETQQKKFLILQFTVCHTVCIVYYITILTWLFPEILSMAQRPILLQVLLQ